MRNRPAWLNLSLAVFATVASHVAVRADDLPRGVVVERVASLADAAQTYALYLPSGYTPEKSWPIIYAFDPGARGKLPVGLFREVAEQHGYIVVGSNNSRNGPGVPLTKILAALWDDTHERFKLDERRVYAAGFSGGARVACYFGYVFEKRVAGVIAAGAGLSENVHPPATTPFALYGIAGVDDFNYFEVKELTQEFADLGLVERMKTIEGGHEWPPSGVCAEAMQWMELQAARAAGDALKNDKLLDELFQRDLEGTRAAEAQGLMYDAYLGYSTLARDFRGLRDVSEFEKKAGLLKDLKQVKDAVREEQKQKRQERALQTSLVRILAGFEDPDTIVAAMVQFQPIVSDLLKKSAAPKDSSDRRVARRTLHGIYVGLFQEASNAYQIKDYPLASRRLETAAQLRPKDPSVLVFLARIYSLQGNKKKAIGTLKRAVEIGLSSPTQLEQHMDFGTLRDEPEFKKLVDHLKTKSP
jgi:tetratricopeptide (TPR) repeat protein